MTPPPEAPPPKGTSARGDVHGQLVQARDIHGGVTVNAPQAPAPVADVSLDPPRPATAVRGRTELLAGLRAAMERGAPVPHVLTGPGGFGKTTVAAALAEHARSEGWTVFWVSPDAILPSMLEVAVELGGSRQEAEQFKTAPRQAARWVWRQLDQSPRPWLLVIDNADRPEELDPENRPGEQRGWMRASPGGFVLVTSRVDDPALWAPAKVHQVKVLEGEDAARALADHAGDSELPGAEALVDRLGGVPLALSLAGRILATHRVLFPDANSLLNRLREGVAELDELAGPLVNGADSERRLLSGVWELSLRMVDEQNPQAAPLLKVLAVLGEEGGPVPMRRLAVADLRDGALDRPEAPLSEESLARAVNALAVHGLLGVERSQEGVILRTHPLVSETVRAGMSEAEDLQLVDEVERLVGLDPGRDPLFDLRALYSLLEIRRRFRPEDTRFAAPTLLSLTQQRIIFGDFETSEGDLRQVTDLFAAHLGPDAPLTLQARHFLAEVWLGQGRLDEAERAYLDVLRGRESVLGADDPRTLDTRHMLALVTGKRGDWEGARARHREVLEARLHVQGRHDVETLRAMDSLAYVTLRLDDVVAAEALYREVSEARLRTLGEIHPQTAYSRYNLGLVFLRRGNRAEAVAEFERSLRTRVALLGEDHHETEWSRQRLAEAEGLPRQESPPRSD